MRMRIWEERMKKNVSLTQLSMRTGISKGALDNYENGKRYPNLEQMERIAKALHTTISDLYESEYK